MTFMSSFLIGPTIVAEADGLQQEEAAASNSEKQREVQPAMLVEPEHGQGVQDSAVSPSPGK